MLADACVSRASAAFAHLARLVYGNKPNAPSSGSVAQNVWQGAIVVRIKMHGLVLDILNGLDSANLNGLLQKASWALRCHSICHADAVQQHHAAKPCQMMEQLCCSSCSDRSTWAQIVSMSSHNFWICRQKCHGELRTLL